MDSDLPDDSIEASHQHSLRLFRRLVHLIRKSCASDVLKKLNISDSPVYPEPEHSESATVANPYESYTFAPCYDQYDPLCEIDWSTSEPDAKLASHIVTNGIVQVIVLVIVITILLILAAKMVSDLISRNPGGSSEV